MDDLLVVEGLRRSFGGVHAVNGMSFAVEAGTVTGLIGPNGAGKSTLIEVVTGFLKPDDGSVRFAGRSVEGMAPHRISQLGMMRTFQLPREWPAMTVLENMLVAAVNGRRDALWRAVLTPRSLARAQAADKERARDVLDSFGLLHLRNELARTLSGGQKRLLEFARLVMAGPKMVLLDEPMAGVNPTMRSRIENSIRELVQRGMTVLLVEHNLDTVEALCNTVVVMAFGQRIAEGTMREMRSHQAVIDAYLGSDAVLTAASDG